MRKFTSSVLAVVALLASVLAVAPASQADVGSIRGEHLECSVGGYTVTADVTYDLDYQGSPGWIVGVHKIVLHTDPNFQMNQLWIDIESEPGQYDAVTHWGGTKATLNDVSEDYTANYDWAHYSDGGSYHSKYEWINDDSDSPAWRMLAAGVGSGNTTAECSDYGTVF
jgi:hypothetical protein